MIFICLITEICSTLRNRPYKWVKQCQYFRQKLHEASATAVRQLW